ncbi:MAG: hypothetical protein WAX04_08170 [Oscillospiraceae bacterium]
MKKLINKTIVLFLIITSISCIFTVQVSALAAEDVIEFQSTYTKDGKFVMPVRICVSGTVSANLVNSKNAIIESFKTMKVGYGTTITYSRLFVGTKSGDYYLNVKFVYPSQDNSGEGFSRRLKITHKVPSPKLSFSQTYQAYTDSGDVKQVFKFDYFNANGKKMNFEIYDQYGNFINKSSTVVKHVNGNCTYNWSYYPTKGGVMVSNGTYILKYWVEGQTPKQMNFEVNLAEG